MKIAFRKSVFRYLMCCCSTLVHRYLDTIHSDTGEVNTISALNLIVFGPELEHLDLIEYIVVDLLKVSIEQKLEKNTLR